MSRIDDLLPRWHDETILPAELRELKELLRTPAGQLALVNDLLMTAAITTSLQSVAGKRSASAPRRPGSNPRLVATGRHRRSRKSPRPTARSWFVPLAIAATLVLATGLVFTQWHRPVAAAAVVQLAAWAGDVQLIDHAGRVTPAQGGAVPVGGAVAVIGASAWAECAYADGSQVTLTADSKAFFAEIDGGKVVDLRHGSLIADIVKQNDRPMRLTTPNAEAVVVGTRFTLSARSDSTRLDVAEGRVELHRTTDRASVMVRDGQFAIAGLDRDALVVLSAATTTTPGSKPPPAASSSLAERLAQDGQVTINFGPAGLPLPTGVLNDAGEEFSPQRGYGWLGPFLGAEQIGPIAHCADGSHDPLPLRAGRRPILSHGELPTLRSTHVGAGWRNYPETWQATLPNGTYRLEIVCGDPRRTQGPHRLEVNGKLIIDGQLTVGSYNRLQNPGVPPFIELKDVSVVISNGLLVLRVGGQPLDRLVRVNTDTALCYLTIVR